MANKIELRSAPHKQVPVADILHNPHRDLKRNPVKMERVDELLESFARTGFWDNIVVRKHPTREDKFELAYGHNRLAALKDRKVEVDTITIPVAKLSDYDMYCAMVDENDMQGPATPAIVIENINKGCDLAEKAFDAIGPEGTWEQFNKAMGRSVTAVTDRGDHDHGFEIARKNYFEGEGIGRAFLAPLLPGIAKMRDANLSAVLSSRYGKTRAAAKTTKAKKKRKQASETTDPKKKAQLNTEADELEAEAERIGKGIVAEDVLMRFDTPKMMTNFVAAVRKLRIPPEQHHRAAKQVLDSKVRDERIAKELDEWWYEASGAARADRERAKRDEETEKFRKTSQGLDFNAYLLKIAEALKDQEKPLRRIIEYMHVADERGHKIVRERIAPIYDLLDALLERERETLPQLKDITPGSKMLTHQKAS